MESTSIKIRSATPDDANNIINWTRSNGMDWASLGSPAAGILAAERDGKPINYLVMRGALMIESIASNPSASRQQLALALKEQLKAIRHIARQYDIHDVYAFIDHPEDDDLEHLAVRRGFETLKRDALHIDVRHLNVK